MCVKSRPPSRRRLLRQRKKRKSNRRWRPVSRSLIIRDRIRLRLDRYPPFLWEGNYSQQAMVTIAAPKATMSPNQNLMGTTTLIMAVTRSEERRVGKSVSVRVDLGGSGKSKKKKNKKEKNTK